MTVRTWALLACLGAIPALLAAQDVIPEEVPNGGPPSPPAAEEPLEAPEAALDDTAPLDPFDGADEPTGTAEEPGGEAPVVTPVPLEEPTGEAFPVSAVIEGQKAFWIRIFSEVHSNQGLLHDGELSQPVYEKLELAGMGLRAQRALIRNRIAHLSGRMRALAEDLAEGRELDSDARDLLGRFPEGTEPKAIREFAKNVRFQRGLADRFLNGLIYSGLYLERMREILAESGVPTDLAFLPHVESSFNYRTYSRAGAAGIWQFTRGTGRQYMKIGYEVDERLDPLIATHAAAALLSENYRALKAWPLAITAYNHGRQSLLKIVAKTGTNDLGHLIEHYDGWLFKFASKNFYSEFLAAREVAGNPERYFGAVEPKPALRYHHVELPFYTDFRATAQALGLERDHLQELNPSLRPPVLQGMKYIPKGYTLRLPEEIPPHQFLAAIPEEMRFSGQKRTTEVVVARGDTLYDIGRRNNVSWQDIAVANNLNAYRSIRPGQRLILPSAGMAKAAARPSASAAALAAAPPAAAPEAPVEVAAVAPVAAVAARPARAEAGRGAKERATASTASGPSAPSSQPPAAIVPDMATTALPLPESVAFQRAEGASTFQDLELHDLDKAAKRAELIAAYGETLGHYAEWAGVSMDSLRRVNGAGGLSLIRPGDRISVPLARVSADDFLQKRHEFHRGREEDFYSVYAVTELSKLRVHRGDTVWSIAQSSNVPMWLFYQHNPTLINGSLQAGATVLLPAIEAIRDIRPADAAARNGDAG